MSRSSSDRSDCFYSMASYNKIQYVRLRNLNFSSSLRDDEAPNLKRSVNKMIGKPVRGLRLMKILFILSLLLNIIGGFKMLLSKSSRDQILTYCETLIDQHTS